MSIPLTDPFTMQTFAFDKWTAFCLQRKMILHRAMRSLVATISLGAFVWCFLDARAADRPESKWSRDELVLEATIRNSAKLSNDLPHLKNLSWTGGEYRDVKNVIESVWDSSWRTIFGTVTEGRYGGFVVDGYDLSPNEDVKFGFFSVQGVLTTFAKGERVLIRAKRTYPQTQVYLSYGFATPLLAGIDAKQPPGQIASQTNSAFFREEAIKNLQSSADRYWADLKGYVQAQETQRQAQAQKQQAAQQAAAIGLLEQEDRVLKYRREQAEKGLPSFQYLLGMEYLKGEKMAKDDKLAKEWFEKAAAQGDSDAKKALQKMTQSK